MLIRGYSLNEIMLAGIASPASIVRDGEGVPLSVRLLSVGPQRITIDGVEVGGEITREDLRAFADYHARKGELIPIDCEHLLCHLANLLGMSEAELVTSIPLLGEKAAAGFASLRLSDDGSELWVDFSKWVRRARELFLADTDAVYGYFSPVIRGLVTPPLRITSIALTNRPAISQQDLLAATDRVAMGVATIRASAAGAHNTGGADVDKLIELAKRMGIDTRALSGEQPDFGPLVAAVTAALDAPRQFLSGIADAIGLSDHASLDQAQGLILALAAKAHADESQLSDVTSRLSVLEGGEKARYIGELMTQGKLTASMKPWAEKQDMAALRDYAASAPVIVKPQRVIDGDQGGARPQGDEAILTDDAARMARTCGIDPKYVAKASGLKTVAAIALALLTIGIATIGPKAHAAAATANRDTAEISGRSFALLQGSNVIWQGTMVAIDGNDVAVPASDTAGLTVVGMAELRSDNSGANYSATRRVSVRRGVFRWGNGDSFDLGDVGSFAYVGDDQTVKKAASVTHNIVAGLIVNVDAQGVWIDTYAIGGQGAAEFTTLNASGNVAVGGTLAVTGNSTLGGTAAVTGNTTVGGTLGVTGNTTVGGTLGVTGNTTVSNITATGTAAVTGNTTVGGTLGVTGNTTVSNITATGTAAVTGNTTVGGTLGVTGNVTGTADVKGASLSIGDGSFLRIGDTLSWVEAGVTNAVIADVTSSD